METSIIRAHGLTKSFGAVSVLRDINLQVAAGSAALICGRNGAGKSTLIRLLAGLAAPTQGHALLFNCPSTALELAHRRRIGVLAHQSFLYRNLTARENLEFTSNLYRLDDRDRLIDSWLERVGLLDSADEMVRSFSRGMEQRLGLARAMITTPDALLIDEPFSSLDSDGVAIASALLLKASLRGCAIVMTAHQPLTITGLNCACYEVIRGKLVPLPVREAGSRGAAVNLLRTAS